jgi:hypothetical protein
VSIVTASGLAVDAEWNFRPVAVPTTFIVSSETALAAASQEIHGTSLGGQLPVKIALASVSDAVVAAAGQATSSDRLLNRLVWVVEADGATMEEGGGPMASTLRPYKAVQQWLIDAATGKYLEARDFAAPGG